MKITAKFRETEHLRFEDTKRIMSTEKFRDFRETGPCLFFIKVDRSKIERNALMTILELGLLFFFGF